MGDIEAAIAAIDSLSIGEKINYSKIALQHGVDRCTLSRRHRGIQKDRNRMNANSKLLNTTQEKQLIKYIKLLCKKGLPPSKEMIGNFATSIARKPVGKCWVNRFIRRHPDELISRWTTGIDNSRHKADSGYKYKLYFELLQQKIEQYNIIPANMYNMDEKGFLIGMISGKLKRIFSKHEWSNKTSRQHIQDGNREWITTIACICADGSAISPGLIYQALSGNIQDTWLQEFDPDEQRVFFSTSPTGWTNNELGLSWVRDIFDRETKDKAGRAHRLLIVDGHGSHISMEFINYCDAHKILLATYPPHSTHTLQPLDVCMFKPLSSAYTSNLTKFLDRSNGISKITKRDFFGLFYSAWVTTFRSETISKAFTATGLNPLDPSKILNRFEEDNKSRPESSGSSSSILSASDWRKIERLLKQAVDDIHSKESKKLSNTISAVTTENHILRSRVEALTSALLHEKKRRQRGKALQLDPPQNYHGGAQFYSPNKVQQARDRETEKQAIAEALQLQKEEAQRVREAQKLQKAQLAEERGRIATAAKEAREHRKAELVAQRLSKKMDKEASKQLQNELKLSRKVTRRASSKTTSKSTEIGAQSSSVVEEPLPVRSSRTRQINPPQRYRT